MSTESILNSIKIMLGITESCGDFDNILIMHINTVFMALSQLGVGTSTPYKIEDENNKWEEFIGEKVNIEAVKSYLYLKVKLLFDPPASSTLLNSTNELVRELEWRLNVNEENGGAYE